MQEILAHSWFADIDIDSISKKKAESPFVPDLSDKYLKTRSKPFPKEEAISEHRKNLNKEFFKDFDAN